MEIEMLKIIGNSLNLSLAIEPVEEETYRKSLPAIYVGGYKMLPSTKTASKESSRNYLTIHSAWYTPCALKYPKLGRFFNIFSVHMWICFAFSLVLAVITVRCISNYAFQTTHTKHTCTNPILTATFSVSQPILLPSHCQCLLTYSHPLHRYVCSFSAGCVTVLRSTQSFRLT